jgi:Cu/Ag efflux pump CusA
MAARYQAADFMRLEILAIVARLHPVAFWMSPQDKRGIEHAGDAGVALSVPRAALIAALGLQSRAEHARKHAPSC